MQSHLTSEQVIALAPDQASAVAARSLSTARAWVRVGKSTGAVWGECKGSGREPYRTQVDLSELAFRCSCPSRKFPCKHGLGLLLLLTLQPEQVAHAEPPGWVTEWLAGRARRSERRQEPPASPEASGEATPARAKSAGSAQGRTAATRDARVATGMTELERWLEDRVRAGLATLQAEAPEAFNTVAARMVDAQAPGVARLLREAGALTASGAGWQARLLDRLSRLHLLAHAFARLDTLPSDTQADVRAAIGFNQSQEELLAGPAVRDRWTVLGRQVEEEERLRVQRTWLWGGEVARPALVLDFVVGAQPLDRSLVPATSIEAELVFYPGGAPLRALVRERHSLLEEALPLPALSLYDALGGYASALSRNPWLERYPLIIGPATLARAEARWYLRDDAGGLLPLAAGFGGAWQLLAMTGGRPFTMAGEWDGERLAPLSAQQGERMIVLER